jgi:predicted transglutaminase-like cysteine proteinase
MHNNNKNNICHRANMTALHYSNQDKYNYNKNKKMQKNQRLIASKKPKKEFYVNKKNTKVTNFSTATVIACSLLFFTSQVICDNNFTNNDIQPNLKNSPRSTVKNISIFTDTKCALFNDHHWQKPTSKTMAVSVEKLPNSYFIFNKAKPSSQKLQLTNSHKIISNIYNFDEDNSIKKSIKYKLVYFLSFLNKIIVLYCDYASSLYPISYQPPLENNIVREAFLFRALLKPFEHLDPLAKEKATLLTILHRLTANAQYEFDMISEGVEDYWSTPKEILARDGKGIDCEDYVTLANFYAMLAQDFSYLPKDAKFGMLIIPHHALFYYERTLANNDNPEVYIIDNFTTDQLLFTLLFSSRWSYLTTLKEYTHALVAYFIYFFTTDDYRSIRSIACTLLKNNYWWYKSSRLYPGKGIQTKNLRIETTEDWDKRINNNRHIGDSISADEIALMQYNYIKNNGGYSIPENIEFSEANINYIEAMEIKNILGYKELSGENTVTNITKNQAKYLIGSYSQNLDKYLTFDDLPPLI